MGDDRAVVQGRAGEEDGDKYIGAQLAVHAHAGLDDLLEPGGALHDDQGAVAPVGEPLGRRHDLHQGPASTRHWPVELALDEPRSPAEALQGAPQLGLEDHRDGHDQGRHGRSDDEVQHGKRRERADDGGGDDQDHHAAQQLNGPGALDEPQEEVEEERYQRQVHRTGDAEMGDDPADLVHSSMLSSAFCACRRFSAWPNTAHCGPSMTSSVISSPRWAGKQCMTRAPGLALATRRSFSWYGPKTLRRCSFSVSWPMLAHTSVYNASASPTMASGFRSTRMVAPVCSASLRASETISGRGSKAGGVATQTLMPSLAPASSSEWHTLLPSPQYNSTEPLRSPKRSRKVWKSASAWQGCSRSLRALITGTRAASASSTSDEW